MSRSLRRKQKLRKLSGQIEAVEHIHCPPEALADAIVLDFPDGACIVWAVKRGQQKYAGAIPASGEQTQALAWLVQDQTKAEEYVSLRNTLCAGRSYEEYSQLFLGAMLQEKEKEDRQHADTVTNRTMRRLMRRKAARA